MFDENKYTTYINKDGRTRVYNKETHKVTSYPRLLMANKLGRPLEADEDVHHILFPEMLGNTESARADASEGAG